jgi:hypothetical protein
LAVLDCLVNAAVTRGGMTGAHSGATSDSGLRTFFVVADHKRVGLTLKLPIGNVTSECSIPSGFAWGEDHGPMDRIHPAEYHPASKA